MTEKYNEKSIASYMAKLPPAFYFFDEIDSTNEELKRRASSGAPCGTLVAANHQSAGKGRMGRSFYSPADTGIYMSILLRPALDFSEGVLITTAASVAVCRAIERCADVSCTIKWVNDVLIGDKKVCGILTEAVMCAGSAVPDNIVLGIGINITTGVFPEDIAGRAGAVSDSLPDGQRDCSLRSALTAAVYEEVMRQAEDLTSRGFMEEYRRRSDVLGKMISYGSKDNWTKARALDIDKDGGLIVEREDGDIITLSTGEISLRKE